VNFRRIGIPDLFSFHGGSFNYRHLGLCGREIEFSNVVRKAVFVKELAAEQEPGFRLYSKTLKRKLFIFRTFVPGIPVV
jgi:hypothetical protein